MIRQYPALNHEISGICGLWTEIEPEICHRTSHRFSAHAFDIFPNCASGSLGMMVLEAWPLLLGFSSNGECEKRPWQNDSWSGENIWHRYGQCNIHKIHYRWYFPYVHMSVSFPYQSYHFLLSGKHTQKTYRKSPCYEWVNQHKSTI